MLSAADLVRLEELVKLAAETAKVFGEAVRDGDPSRITDIADRMDGTADELIQAAQAIDARRAKPP